MESKKRKPLADLTNTYNLIPTSTLRKLVAASAGSNLQLCSESSNRSDTSIGSSNVSATKNSRTVQFPTPPRAISSVTSLGGLESKDAAHNQREIVEKSKKERESAVRISSGPTPVEKRYDKGKGIAVPFSSPPPQKMNNNQNEACNRASLLERKKQKGEANLSLFGGPADIVKESDMGIVYSYSGSNARKGQGKAILNSSGCAMEKQEGIWKSISDHDGKKAILEHSGPSTLKTKDIGKEFVNPSSFIGERTKEKGRPRNPFNSSHEKAREKGKAILQPSDIVELTKDKGTSAAVPVNCRPPRRKSERRKNDAGASSCAPMTRKKNTQNDLDENRDFKSLKSWTDPHPKCRKKRPSRLESTSELPLDFIEQQRAYFKEIDAYVLDEEVISEDELDKDQEKKDKDPEKKE